MVFCLIDLYICGLLNSFFFVICEDLLKKNVVKINLENYESEIIKESSG